MAKLRRGSLSLLKACPPCQGFSTLANGKPDESRNDLVLDIVRFIDAIAPRVVLLENVPGLRHDRRLTLLFNAADDLGYRFCQYLVDAREFGVPQRRKRLIVLGLSKSVRRRLPTMMTELLPAEFDLTQRTVGDAFKELRKARRTGDPLDRYRHSGPEVVERIMAIPVGGSRYDLPDRLQLECHKRLKVRRATAPYGRLRLDEPAPTLTTRCTTPACGTFVHPLEHRGISLREAAALQTFPPDYLFEGNYGAIERQIGNAVPVRMAYAFGLVALALAE